MAAGAPDREPAFSWPPSTDDLDRIDVVDTRHPPQVPTPSHETSPSSASRLRLLASHVGPVVRRSVASGARLTARTRARMPARPRIAPLAQRAAMVAAGVLLGVTLPLLGGGQEGGSGLPVAEAVAAQAATPATSEAQAILRMRERLRKRVVTASATTVAPSVAPRKNTIDLDMPTPAAPAANSAWLSPATSLDPWTTSVLDGWVAARAVATGSAPVSRRVRTSTRRTFSEENFSRMPARPEDTVLRTVTAYQEAWTRMDSAAAHAIWPSANTEALTRQFTSLREQRLHLGNCVVGTSGNRATAICPGTLRYRPRVGDHSTRTRHGTWEFQLERTPKRWVIRNVDAP